MEQQSSPNDTPKQEMTQKPGLSQHPSSETSSKEDLRGDQQTKNPPVSKRGSSELSSTMSQLPTSPNEKEHSSTNEPQAKIARKRTATDKANADSAATKSPQNYAVVPITPTSALAKRNQLFRVETKSDAAAENPDDRKSSETISARLSLPGQITNLFASQRREVVACQCLETKCTQPNCISSTYLKIYGWEYKALLRESEDQEFHRNKSQSELPEKSKGLAPLVACQIIPPLETRSSRAHTEWSGPQSACWNLKDYMERQPELAPKMRGILIDWVIELSEEYKLSPTTVHLAITLIDKSLACTPLVPDSEGASPGFYVARDLLQCLGCACTWIAAKMEEVVSPSIDDFVYISDNIYAKEQIAQMEIDVCNVLKFRLHHATPVNFAHEYLLASQDGLQNATSEAFHPMLRNMVFYLLELSRMSYELVSTRPSIVAAAAVFLARATLGICSNAPEDEESNGIWTHTLQYYTGYTVKELKGTIQILLLHHRCAEESQFNAVFNKYNKAKYMYVSTKTVLSLDDLGF